MAPTNPAGAPAGSQPRIARRLRVWPQEHDTILIACCRTRDDNLHAGVVFRDAGPAKRLMMFHQAWQKITPYVPLDEVLVDMGVKGLSFVTLEMPRPIALPVLEHFRSIASMREHAIPYAFGLPEDANWDKADEVPDLANGLGLTCVNFVLLLLKSAGQRLIDRQDWPRRDQDKEKQEEVYNALVKWCRRNSPGGVLSQEDVAHLANVKKEIESGCIRVRPEELMAAALHPTRPATHAHAIPTGPFMLDVIDANHRAFVA